MKTKGFTLIELLGVIVLLSLLFLFLYPSIKKTLNYSKEKTYDTQINTILKASYDYTLEHPEVLPSTDSTYNLNLATLKSSGLIDTNIVDPNTNQPFSDSLTISIRLSSCTSNTYCYQNGDYSYTVNIN